MNKSDYEELIGQIVDVFEDAIWDMRMADDDTVVFCGERYDHVASLVGNILKTVGIHVEEKVK